MLCRHDRICAIMDQTSPVRRVRGAFAALMDVGLAFLGLAIVVAILVATLNVRANSAIARIYARQSAFTDQAACPSNLGNTFWFACAAEVRRLHPLSPGAGSASVVAPNASPTRPADKP